MLEKANIERIISRLQLDDEWEYVATDDEDVHTWGRDESWTAYQTLHLFHKEGRSFFVFFARRDHRRVVATYLMEMPSDGTQDDLMEAVHTLIAYLRSPVETAAALSQSEENTLEGIILELGGDLR